MTADYSKLIDTETWAFIDRTNSFYPANTSGSTLEDSRRFYDTMCSAFNDPYPEGVTARDTRIAAGDREIPIRIYTRADPDATAIILYLHGGAFILGGLESHDSICADLCLRTGLELVSVDYRLAPEHLHPAAFDDAMAAFEWAADTYAGSVILCGDSAGANLCAAVAHAARGRGKPPAGQVLIYPGLGGDVTKGSYVEHADAPLLTMRDIVTYRGIRTGGPVDAGDVTLWPLADTDFTALPPTVIITAQCDPLSSDGEAYRDAILHAGGRAFWHDEAGLVHGYLRGRHMIGRARASFTRIADALNALAYRDWPY